MDDLGFLILYGVLAGVAFASLRKAFHDPKVCSYPSHRSSLLPPQLDEIPVVGSSGFLSSYLDALNFLHNAPELIQRGYDQYPEGIFRVARLFKWEYVVCGPKLIKDLGGAPEHVVSFTEGVEEVRAKSSPPIISNHRRRQTIQGLLHFDFLRHRKIRLLVLQRSTPWVVT
jgi:hypothetical protein